MTLHSLLRRVLLLPLLFSIDFLGDDILRDSLLVHCRQSPRQPIPTRLRHLSPLKIAQLGALVKEKVTISTIASRYIDIQSSGASSKKTCLCPFHDDQNPSMHLNDEKGLFHCFSCKSSGDTIKFVQDIEKLPFIEALKKVASLAGTVPIERISQSYLYRNFASLIKALKKKTSASRTRVCPQQRRRGIINDSEFCQLSPVRQITILTI
jgi:hypothetical protein